MANWKISQSSDNGFAVVEITVPPHGGPEPIEYLEMRVRVPQDGESTVGELVRRAFTQADRFVKRNLALFEDSSNGG